MNSSDHPVAELLPWYLNGTLDEREQGEVRAHLEGCAECRRALEETRLALRIYDQHLPSETLVALAWGEDPEGIDPGAAERHLESCPRCAAELEMARMSRRLEEDDRVALFPTSARPEKPVASRGWRTAAMAAGLAGAVAASGWLWTAGRANDLEEQLARAGDQPVQAAPVPVPDAGGGGGGNNRVAEMAAEVERLRQQEAELRQEQERMREQLSQIAGARPAAPAPQINAWIGELRPTQDVVRGSGSTGEELPAGRPASLILMARHPETHRGHRVEIVDSGGKTVWSAEGLVSNPETKDYGLTLPADTLKPGEYTIRVSALEDGKRVELESYTVRVK